MIDKDKNIIYLVKWLHKKLKNKLIIKDYWESDLTSIGILCLDKEKLLYISALNTKKYKFNVECEYLNKERHSETVLYNAKNISKHKILKILIK